MGTQPSNNTSTFNMASMAASLSRALPTPKYTGEEEDIPQHAQQRGTRIVGAGTLDDTQIVLKRSGPPPYGKRAGWRPRGQEDFGDGGAFPEIPGLRAMHWPFKSMPRERSNTMLSHAKDTTTS